MNETATVKKPREKIAVKKPPRERERLAEPVKIRFRPTVLDQLEQLAEDRGSTVNEIVRRLVDDGLAPKKRRRR